MSKKNIYYVEIKDEYYFISHQSCIEARIRIIMRKDIEVYKPTAKNQIGQGEKKSSKL